MNVTSLVLDRMAVDDAATSPERIAAEIHRQLGKTDQAVPVFDIARALDIERIEERPVRSCEAVLITSPERDFGHVLLNSCSGPRRRRYSLAHELGHFLCAWHKQTSANGFACSRGDMASPTGNDLHVTQEREANSFAIELLAPGYLVEPFLKRQPELEVVLALHKRLDISRIAAARRYVSLHSQPLAIVVARQGRFVYVERNADFPYIPFERGDQLPALPFVKAEQSTSSMDDADPADWRMAPSGGKLFNQVLAQDDGYSLVLLHLEPDGDDD